LPEDALVGVKERWRDSRAFLLAVLLRSGEASDENRERTKAEVEEPGILGEGVGFYSGAPSLKKGGGGVYGVVFGRNHIVCGVESP